MDMRVVVEALQRKAVMYRILIGITLIQLENMITVSAYTIPWTCYPEIGSCYYLSEFETTQLGASCWCGGGNGQLLKIDSAQELTKIRELITEANKPMGYYIGASDRHTEGVYVWEDGNLANGMIPWHNWGSSSEPDNYQNSEHCAVLTNKLWWESPPRVFPNYDAFDFSCDMDINFICESKHDPGHLMDLGWKQVSNGLSFTSEIIASIPSRSVIHCGTLCSQNCECLSMAYQQEESICLLYRNYFSRLTSVSSPGYINFEQTNIR